MRKIWNIPIENLEERYSAQWNNWIPVEFDRLGVDFTTVWGPTLTKTITAGSFLDVCSTNYFKAGQLQGLISKIYDGEVGDDDIVFFNDLWCPGLESLQYIRNGIGAKFKICGILHAGTYDPYDFLAKKGMASWGEALENSWFSFVNEIYVATDFHKQLLLQNRPLTDENKIKVTGLPIYHNRRLVPWDRKENIVVFPHRLDSEKNPQMFDQFAKKLPGDWQFIKTKDVCNSKKEYYNLLDRAKIAVSFADQETWGIAQQEALFAGCFPVVPDRLSYKELYFADFRYQDNQEAMNIARRLMNPTKHSFESLDDNRKMLLRQGHLAILNIVLEMEKL